MKNFPTTILLLLLTSQLYAQLGEKQVATTNQQWFQYYNTLQLTEKWSVHTDGGIRFRELFDERSQHIARTGLGYKIGESTRVVAGIAHLGAYRAGEFTRRELRPYQELTHKGKIGKLGLNHRYRIEQRFFKDKSLLSSDPFSFNWRFRYGVTLSIPIAKLSKTNPDRQLLLNLSDEIFINAGSEVINNVFNQNRVLISPTLKVNKDLAISLTWNSQFGGKSAPGEFQYTDIFWLQIKHKIDLTD